MPAFSSPIDCTPWVTGGLWPAELSPITAQTATLAEYLKADLQRIADSVNDELKIIRRAGMADSARQAQEARVIDEGRARAVRRVESTIRHLHSMRAHAATQVIPAVAARDDAEAVPVADAREQPAAAPSHLEDTQVIPAITGEEPPVLEPVDSGRHQAGGGDAAAPSPLEDTQVIPAVSGERPPVVVPGDSGRHHAVEIADADSDDAAPPLQSEETQNIPAVTAEEPPVVVPNDSGRHHAGPGEDDTEAIRLADAAGDTTPPPVVAAVAENVSPTTAFNLDRLNRFLEFVVRQEPRLHWAVGDRADGTTVLATDLAHGWIPSGITLPAGVRLLEPESRTGSASALIGDTTRAVTYAPGDALRRSGDFSATKSSVEPRELPAVENLETVLSETIRRRDGLPRIVRRLAEAAAAGARIVDQEVDVLRVHLDTARYQLVTQHPGVNPALLLNCLLLAATEALASGDPISANYHFAWYQKLAASS